MLRLKRAEGGCVVVRSGDLPVRTSGSPGRPATAAAAAEGAGIVGIFMVGQVEPEGNIRPPPKPKNIPNMLHWTRPLRT